MVVVEIYGEPDTGKTHCAVSFPEPIVVDFTSKRESLVEVLKQYQNRDRHVTARGKRISDVKRDIRRSEIDIRTIVVETSQDLRKAYGEKWCRRHEKDAVYPPENWGDVNTMLEDDFIQDFSSDYNIMFTSIMKDEYVKDVKTGNRVRKGASRMDFISDLRFKTSEDSHDMSVIKIDS